MQACSFLHVALVVLCVVVLVGVGRVTVVHIGHEDVVVVIYFCVAIFVRDLLYQEMYSLQILLVARQVRLPEESTVQEK